MTTKASAWTGDKYPNMASFAFPVGAFGGGTNKRWIPRSKRKDVSSEYDATGEEIGAGMQAEGTLYFILFIFFLESVVWNDGMAGDRLPWPQPGLPLTRRSDVV